MKKSSVFVIGIPLFVVALVIVAVFVFRATSQKPVETVQIPANVVPTLKGEVGKPNSGFSDTVTTTAVGDLSSDLNSIKDDGGVSDFSALEAQAAQL